MSGGRRRAGAPHPDAEIIDRLGGPAALAPLCELTESAVRYWRSNGIPHGYRLFLRLRSPQAFETSSERQATP